MDNLLKDVREAERLGYGVHYGHYKVDHPHTADVSVDLEPDPILRKCAECGGEFVPAHGNQLYCCVECKDAAKRAAQNRHYQIHKATRVPLSTAVCVVCGAEFKQRKRTQLCCSRSCAARNRNPYRLKTR